MPLSSALESVLRRAFRSGVSRAAEKQSVKPKHQSSAMEIIGTGMLLPICFCFGCIQYVICRIGFVVRARLLGESASTAAVAVDAETGDVAVLLEQGMGRKSLQTQELSTSDPSVHAIYKSDVLVFNLAHEHGLRAVGGHGERVLAEHVGTLRPLLSISAQVLHLRLIECLHHA